MRGNHNITQRVTPSRPHPCIPRILASITHRGLAAIAAPRGTRSACMGEFSLKYKNLAGRYKLPLSINRNRLKRLTFYSLIMSGDNAIRGDVSIRPTIPNLTRTDNAQYRSRRGGRRRAGGLRRSLPTLKRRNAQNASGKGFVQRVGRCGQQTGRIDQPSVYLANDKEGDHCLCDLNHDQKEGKKSKPSVAIKEIMLSHNGSGLNLKGGGMLPE